MRTVRLSDHGIYPNTDITIPLYQLMQQYPCDTVFEFENAEYYFSPHEAMRADYRLSNSDPMPDRVLAIWMKGMRRCTLKGNGARLWLSGHMQVFTLDDCEDVKIEGFTVDWKKPLVAEGEIVAVDGHYFDVYVDPDRFPHRFQEGNLEFDVGAGEWYKMFPGFIAFEPHNRTVRRGSGDIWIAEMAPLGDSIYRLTVRNPQTVQVGDLLNLRHNSRIHAGVFSERCRNLTVENVTFHSCGGLGCLAQFCQNLTYRAVHFLPDTAAGRRVSAGRDDGMHITCNSGTVTITECSFHALMDDPINVHGCCVTSNEVVAADTLRCHFRHRQAQGFLYWAKPGDEIVFIDRGAMNPIAKATVASYTLESLDTFSLRFDSPLPETILDMARAGECLALDNLTNTAAFVCTKNRFGSCRARSILISTPKKVLIADNYFESSGSAILVAGDSNYWFESGACHDVEITRNVFTDACLTSDYQFCHGVISVCPVVPKPEVEKPYHRNIRMTDNIFDVADTPVLYAYSCEELTFANNRILRSPGAERWHKGESAVHLAYCRQSVVRGNDWIGNFKDFTTCEMAHCEAVDTDIPVKIVE